MNEFIGYGFILLGLALDVVGCLSLIRFPDVYSRLQGTTKCVLTGTCVILAGTIVLKGFTATGVKALLCVIFLLLTSPVVAHALSRGERLSRMTK